MSAEDEIASAVRSAVSERMSIQRFKEIAAECWIEELREEAADVRKEMFKNEHHS